MARFALRAGAFLLIIPSVALLAQGPVDTSRRVILRGNVPPRAALQNDQGPVDPFMKVEYATLALRRSDRQQADLDRWLDDRQDSSSPNYHKWLTPEQYADRFGASQGDVATVAAWLRAQGLVVNDVARGRGWVEFSGTAQQAERAFQTEIHHYLADGKLHFANASPPSIPAGLEPVVLGVMGLDDFRPDPPRARRSSNPGAVLPAYTNSSGTHTLAPGDLAAIYDINPLYSSGIDGTSQTIAIVGESAIDLNDIRGFRSNYNLPPRDPQIVVYGPDPGVTGGEEEADLDIEWSGAIAPGANIIYIYSKNPFSALEAAVDQNLAPVVSFSFAGCEQKQGGTAPIFFRSLAQQANAQGITWLASSGDTGAAACDPNPAGEPLASYGLSVGFPASIPEVTAVGGTEFNEGGGTYWSATNGPTGGSAQLYIPEIGWNDSQALSVLEASGGGASTFYLKPSWQIGPGVPNDNARDVPDVSLAASAYHDGYSIFAFGGLGTSGGTSASTPSFAGIVALLNHYLVSNGFQSQPGVGNINSKLYRLAEIPNHVFHDITSGSNIVPCAPGTPNCVNGSLGYSAGPGYDMVTGLGSVDAYNLVTGWNTPPAVTTTSIAASPSNINLSDATRLTVTVTAVQGPGAPSGTVTFLLGEQLLGTATLVSGGNSGTAALTVYGGQLVTGANQIVASYSGNNSFDGSGASTTVNVKIPTANSAVVPSISPNPVYQQPANSQGYTFIYTITLNEVAGIGTTLTSFTYDGAALTLSSFFGSTHVLPNGSMSVTLGNKPASVPVTHIFGFTGVDSSGFQWTQQIPVVFLGPQLVMSVNSVTNAFRTSFGLIAPNTWVAIMGTNLTQSGDTRSWQTSDFVNNLMPTKLDGVSVTMNGENAFVSYISPTQLNVLTPPDLAPGPVVVEVSNAGGSAAFSVEASAYSPAFIEFNGGPYVVGAHPDGSLVGPTSLFPGLTTPAKPGETVAVYATGFGPTSPPVVSGSPSQVGTLAVFPVVKIGGITAKVAFAGLVGPPGEFQINVTVPSSIADGDQTLTATYNGSSAQATLITIQH